MSRLISNSINIVHAIAKNGNVYVKHTWEVNTALPACFVVGGQYFFNKTLLSSEILEPLNSVSG